MSDQHIISGDRIAEYECVISGNHSLEEIASRFGDLHKVLMDLQSLRDTCDALASDLRSRMTAYDKAKNYVHVVCSRCSGHGCTDCGDRGWLWARKFEGKKGHDMEHNEVRCIRMSCVQMSSRSDHALPTTT